MKQDSNIKKISLSYFANGDRSAFQYNPLFRSTQCCKGKALNMLERNYIQFPSNEPVPRYKQYHTVTEVNSALNNYLTPAAQYQYEEKLKKNDCPLYSLEKAKRFASGKNEIGLFDDKKNNSSEITLKAAINHNILHPNILPLQDERLRQKPPNKHPDMSIVKAGSYLESKGSPEYLRQYDKEKLHEIDDYYNNHKINRSYLSRFGDWITMPPGTNNRKMCLERIKQGTYETSIVAPEWMDLKLSQFRGKRDDFKPYQWKNTCKDNTKVTMLVDKNQKDALPVFLRDSYELNAELLKKS